MREILFRAKHKETGKWLFGYYVLKALATGVAYPTIIDSDLEYQWAYPIDPETLGQYTGLKDKNGKMIFEGDIVVRQFPWLDDEVYEVVWLESSFGTQKTDETYPNPFDDNEFGISTDMVFVAGNIYDNPDLLKKKGE